MLTEATRGEGVPELWTCIEEHRAFLAETGELERRRSRNLANEVFALASARAKEHLVGTVEGDPDLARLLAAVKARELDPLSAVAAILEQVFRIPPP